MKTNNQKKIDFITNNILGKCFILDNSKDDDPERNGYYIFSTPSLINLDDSPNFFKKGIFVHGQLQTSFHISMFDGVIGLYSLIEQDSSNGEYRLKSNIREIEESNFSGFFNLFKCPYNIICSGIEDAFRKPVK